jgi:signal peptidase I
MIPTLEVGDRIFVNKFVYGLQIPGTSLRFGARPPAAGDVIVFPHPREPDVDLIKRVVATEGDLVEVRGGVLHVNGVATVRGHVDGDCSYHDYVEGEGWVVRACDAWRESVGGATFTALRAPGEAAWQGPWRVPRGRVFAMGDNRDNSSDSRMWGFVPVDSIRGRAMVVWWSHGEPEGVRLRRLFTRIE